MEEKLTVTFDNVTLAEAGQLATELQAYLRYNIDLETEINKEERNTQDMGTVLTIILGSKAIVEISKGLSAWLLKKQSRKITIRKNGDIIGKNLSSKEIKEILDSTK